MIGNQEQNAYREQKDHKKSSHNPHPPLIHKTTLPSSCTNRLQSHENRERR